MTYYKCKNCNYKTYYFTDMKAHLYKTNFCKIEFNDYTFRDLKFKNTLKKWDRVDKDGNPIDCNEKTIGELPSDLAVALINKFDRISFLDEEEEKN